MSSFLILILVLIVVFYIFVGRKLFNMVLNHIILANGGVGSGKTTLVMSLSQKQYRKEVFKWYIKRILFFWKKVPKPLFYCNQKVSFPYVPLTKEIIYGDKAIVPHSVVCWTEVSLSADSMSFKSIDLKKFEYFIKLFRHQTLGGYLFLDTQSISDLNYIIRRSINSYVWIENCNKNFPFVLIYRVRQFLLNDDSTINVTSDVQNESRLLIVFKKVWKTFDSYNYHGLYQNLPLANYVINNDKNTDLRTYDLDEIIDLTIERKGKK